MGARDSCAGFATLGSMALSCTSKTSRQAKLGDMRSMRSLFTDQAIENNYRGLKRRTSECASPRALERKTVAGKSRNRQGTTSR